MNRRIKSAWAFYDWANSVYSLVISTAVFPIYFSAVSPEKLHIFGNELPATTVYSYVLASSFIIVSLISPFLSGIADYTGSKKAFMRGFCYVGSLACMSMYFFTDANIWFGLLMSMVASVGFWGSLVFYNAYLPEVCEPDDQDKLSARGFALGYFGSSILLIIILAMVQAPDFFGLADSGIASRIGFLITGLWWLGFAHITFAHLPKGPVNPKAERDPRWIFSGYKEIRQVFRNLKKFNSLRRFLYSFFFFSIGVQTVILLASLFGEAELGLETSKLIATILIIQFVGVGGAYLFAAIAKKYGNMLSLKICIVIWALVCFAAYTLTSLDPLVEYKFYAIGGVVGLVMGGIQSVSRSTYSKMLPATHAHASYFSFYDVSEKVAIVIGTFTYGYLISLTGDMKTSALALSIFFAIGFLLLLRVKKTDHVH